MEIKLKILIYGGTGYLGTSLTSGIRRKNTFYVTTRRKKISSSKNAKVLNEKKDKKKIKKILKFVDLIIIANGPSFEDSKKNFFNYIKYLDSELDIIKKIKKEKTKIIYFSTIHIYNNSRNIMAKTSDLSLSKNHYSLRNIICENLILNKFNFKNINIIRLSNIFGIHEKIEKLNPILFRLAINNFCLQVVKNKNIFIRSNKRETRNFVSVNDFVNFIEKGFMNKSKNFKSIINYASEKVISLNEIIKHIQNQSKILKLKNPRIHFENKIKKTKINYNFKINEIKKRNLKPKISIKNEIYNTLNKIKNLKNGKY